MDDDGLTLDKILEAKRMLESVTVPELPNVISVGNESAPIHNDLMAGPSVGILAVIRLLKAAGVEPNLFKVDTK
jgi:hypothetical protein